MAQEAKSILLIGGPDTGKTHYFAQLYGRLSKRDGKLVTWRSPVNIVPLEEALNKLNQGLPASHTSTDTYQEITFPLKSSSGDYIDLVWPDYGGEQVQQLRERRQVSSEWCQRIEKADGWLFFIRPDRVCEYKDISTHPVEELISPRDTAVANLQWSDQAGFIELLQMLLFIKNVDTSKRIRKPAIGIILSCWDELQNTVRNNRPPELLQQILPLFATFLNALWEEKALFCMGLSSLGKALKPEEEDEDYKNQGPEEFGYIVLQDGTKSPDLTLPVFELMQQLS